MADTRARLNSVPTLQTLSESTLDELATRGRVVRIPQGWTPIHQQEPADEAYLVLKGSFAVVRDGQHVSELGFGDFAGEMGLVDNRVRNARVTAQEELEVLAWPAQDFLLLRQHHEDLDRMLQELVAKRREENTRNN